jgi:Transposase IS116/IS110/IS902 family
MRYISTRGSAPTVDAVCTGEVCRAAGRSDDASCKGSAGRPANNAGQRAACASCGVRYRRRARDASRLRPCGDRCRRGGHACARDRPAGTGGSCRSNRRSAGPDRPDRWSHDHPHRSSEVSQRIAGMPGIGPITASAIVASVPDASVFRSGREFVAWLGLVPKQSGTGGKTWLGRISKRSDGYIRRLLVTGTLTALTLTKRRNYCAI